MTIEELNVKIEKKKVDIEKRKNITLKFEKKLEKLTSESEKRWTQEDIKTSNYKLRDLEIQLKNLYKQREKLKVKMDIKELNAKVEGMEENWQVKTANYHDKKKGKLWINVIIEKINDYNPRTECNNTYLSMVEFKGNSEPVILWSVYNSMGLPKQNLLTIEQQELVIQAAILKAKQYLK